MNMRFKFYVHMVCTLALLLQGQHLAAAAQMSCEEKIQIYEQEMAQDIQAFMRRPYDAQDNMAAKCLYNDICARYIAYKEGNGECPGEILWFWTENPDFDRSLFKAACAEDALDSRVKRERNLLQLCLESEFNPPREIGAAARQKFERIHTWAWRSRPSEAEVLIALSKVPAQHVRCKSKWDAAVSEWCVGCTATLRQVVSDRVIRRVGHIRDICAQLEQ